MRKTTKIISFTCIFNKFSMFGGAMKQAIARLDSFK